jgi:hypothetical protein
MKMKKIIVWCLIATFAVLNVEGCKCKYEKPKEPPMVEKPKPIPAIPIILKVLKIEGGWEVTLNKKAEELVRKGQAEVRLHIDYCWYAGEIKKNKVVFQPDWHPGGRVSVGIWQLSRTGLEGKYLSSVFVNNVKRQLPVTEKIDQVMNETLPPLPPPPSEISREEAIKRLERPKTNLVIDQTDIKPETSVTPTPKIETEAGRSADSLRNVW